VILWILAALQAAATVPPSEEAQLKDCVSLAKSNPKQAITAAEAWKAHGGGIAARQCVGMAYAAIERWEPAATAFEQAASEADKLRDPRRGDLWVQAGNSWLAADEGIKARADFDRALAAGTLSPALQGETWLDRGRAAVALGQLAAAREDINKGLVLVPADPFAWYLSAALAMRQEDMARAQQDTAHALSLAPDDPDILVLAGNLAGSTGEPEAAATFYERAIRAAPDSAAAKAARASLAANSAKPAAAAPAAAVPPQAPKP